MIADYETLQQCILCGSDDIETYCEKALVSRCRQCRLLFDTPRPTLESIIRFYSQKGRYEEGSCFEESLTSQLHTVLKRLLGYKDGGKLLDIGAGTGLLLSLAEKHFEIFGTEVSVEAIRIARERYGIHLIEGDVETIDFGGKQFDVILLGQVLEHVQYPGKTLHICKSLLKPDGILYLSVPNEPLYSLRMLIPGFLSRIGRKKYEHFMRNGLRKIDCNSMKEIHLSHFSEPMLRRFLKSLKFKLIDGDMDFVDPLILKRWPFQILRHSVYCLARLLRMCTGIYIYNVFWLIAKKEGHS